MKVDISQLDKYIYKKYGGKIKTVLIFDKTLLSGLSGFYLHGTMMINKNNAKTIARAFLAAGSCMIHPDLEFDDPNK